MYKLGLVIPVYNSTKSVKILLDEIDRVLLGVCHHSYLVDDSGKEEIFEYLKAACWNKNTTIIRLCKNYGQQSAILCGVRQAIADCDIVGTMDDDLQDEARLLPQMLQLVEKGRCDLVYAVPKTEARGAVRQLGSRLRDGFFTAVFGLKGGLKVSGFRMMSHTLAQKVCLWQGGYFYMSAAALQHKPNVKNIVYHRRKRPFGKSGYNLKRLSAIYFKLLVNYSPLKRFFKEKTVDTPYKIKEILKGEPMKKLMLLGGGNCQLSAARYAFEQGIEVVLADYTPMPPAAKYAKKHLKISTFDIPACLENARSEGVNGVMTIGTDQPVYTGAVISEKLKLPATISVETAFAVTNKQRMKTLMTQNGIPTVNYCFIGENSTLEEMEKLSLPLVIKPLDSQGQRGIFKLSTPQEVLEHLKKTLSFSRCPLALVEEFYDSDEITVSGWVKNGKLYPLTITDRLLYPSKKNIGICIGHRFPSVHMDRHDEIVDICNRLVSVFKIGEGALYVQLLVGEKGIKVNELACRIGGAFEDFFIPYVTGFNILKAVVNSSLGEKVSVEELKGFDMRHCKKYVATQLTFCDSGRVKSITPLEEIKAMPYIIDAGYNYHEGDTLPMVENATARFGHAVIVGENEEALKSYIDDFYSKLQVKSDEGKELLHRFYPAI
ncbi:MAG: glycosyltransferase [Oscillospiraceae bacterium]